MPWQVLMLAQNLLAASFAVNSRTIAKKFHHATAPFNLIIYFVIAASGVAYAAITDISALSITAFTHHAALFIFAGLCFAVTNMISYVVFQYVDAAIASLLSTLNIIATIILSTLIIREGLNWREIIGAIVLLGGMELILSLNVSHYRHKRIWQAVLLSVVSAVFFGIAMTSEKYLLNHVGVSNYLVFGWGFQFVGVILVSLVFGRHINANFRLLTKAKFWHLALPASLIRMLGGLTFVISLKLANNLSLITVVSGLKIILAALLAAYFLKETNYLSRKLEAATLAAVGIAIIYL